jgi:hypothetical protein
MKKLMLGTLFLALVVSGCKKGSTISYPESADGLKSLVSDMIAAQKAGDKGKLDDLVKSLELPDPDAFAKQVFGDEKGAKIAADYKSRQGQFDSELHRVVAKMVDDGQTEVKAQRFDRADDPQAVGGQKDVMTAMKNPVPLYSARITKPGEPLGMHLYNFVYVNGTFRLAAKMEAARQ